MDWAHTYRQVIGREALLALLVVALMFLNFGHANFAFAKDGQVVSSATVYCGNPLSPGDGDHQPCHACRMGQSADLPPVPCVIEAVSFAVLPVVYETPTIFTEPVILLMGPRSRAPPVA